MNKYEKTWKIRFIRDKIKGCKYRIKPFRRQTVKR